MLETVTLGQYNGNPKGPGLLDMVPITPLKLAPGLNGALANYVDIKAPGIREEVPHPSFLSIWPTRSSLYQHATGTDTLNNAPIPNWGNAVWADGADCPSWLQSKWHRQYGTAWYEVTQQTPVIDDFIFRDYGQFNVPNTGFSALKDIVPRSTLGWL